MPRTFKVIGVLFFVFGLWAVTQIVSDIQFTLAVVSLASGMIMVGIALILDAIAKLNRRLTELIGAENPKPVPRPVPEGRSKE